jgi:hypothetical protein
MELVGLVGFSVFTLACWAVGIRLLWLGSQTRQIPELAIGGSFVFAGGISCVLSLLVDAGRAAGSASVAGMLAAQNAALAFGVGLLAVFVWRTFRPTEPWGVALFGASILGLLVGHLGKELSVGFSVREPGAYDWIGMVARIVVYGWAAGEALREHLAARRRCAIGLADPLVANRFLLWGIGIAAVLVIWLHNAYSMATGGDPRTAFLLIAGLGMLCAASLWLAFFPPAFYRRHFVRPAAA